MPNEGDAEVGPTAIHPRADWIAGDDTDDQKGG